MIIVGTAGWSIPRTSATQFRGQGTNLERYARVFTGVEIDTSFYREHARETYARWASQTPRTFRFAVKLPREITHDNRLRAVRRPFEGFLSTVTGLGRRLGPLIVQLPPSLDFEPRVAQRFFALLRQLHEGTVVCEPRHRTWFTGRAEDLLGRYRIGRIAADPAVVPEAARPGGWSGIVYYRLHGSPRMYWSVYESRRIAQWSEAMRALPRNSECWCVFDNTAGGGAAGNALQMQSALRRRRPRRGDEV